ncbi:hypothetical protein [Parapedobacter sp. 2B3]|uniref:hypothetical protein n=1 Tax=Parapedobacter sp. 2B3 TaxID=3342381 RepID=UPI0035B6A49D
MHQQTIVRKLHPRDYVDSLHDAAMAREARPFPWPWVGVPLLLILFLYLGPLLWWIDATAAVPDIGVLSLVVLAALAAMFFWLLAAWLAWAFFKRLAGFDREDFRSSFNTMKPWKQMGCYLSVSLSLFWGLVVVLAALM